MENFIFCLLYIVLLFIMIQWFNSKIHNLRRRGPVSKRKYIHHQVGGILSRKHPDSL